MKRLVIFISIMFCVIAISGCSKATVENKTSTANRDEQIKKDTKTKVQKEQKEETVTARDKGQTEKVQDSDYNFKYNPYVLSKDFTYKYGEEYLEFYRNFVDAYINYETSCPCPKEEYSYEVDFLTSSSFVMFTSDAYFDNEKGVYDKDSKTIRWFYKSKTKEEHDKKVKEFEDQVATYMHCLQKGDSDFEKTITIYSEFNGRMKYNIDHTSTYEALMEGVGKCTSLSAAYCHLLLQAGVDAITDGGFSKKSGGHRWNIVHLYNKDYFMDPTYEVGSQGSGGKGLLYFGMSLKEREEMGGFSIDTSQYGDVNGLKAMDYVNSDDYFSVLRNCVEFELDRNKKCIVYYNKEDKEPKMFYYE